MKNDLCRIKIPLTELALICISKYELDKDQGSPILIECTHSLLFLILLPSFNDKRCDIEDATRLQTKTFKTSMPR